MNDNTLRKYAELIIKVGVNVQAGQRLMIGTPIYDTSPEISQAQFVKHLVTEAYKVGASYVDVMWNSRDVMAARFENAPRDSFSEFPTWRVDGIVEHIKGGNPILILKALAPNFLTGWDMAAVKAYQQADVTFPIPMRELTMVNVAPWCVASAPTVDWAKMVFPDLSPEEAYEKMWDAVFKICRADQDDPIGAWKTHIARLHERAEYLNAKAYDALHMTAPGTDLTIGLPTGHIWQSGSSDAQTGVTFTANIPTEEVFTLPHRERVDGTVTSTRPLSFKGSLIDKFSLKFENGRVVNASAEVGEDFLNSILDTDEGSRHLGEVALLPNSSPISASGILFYNTLYDENASNHIALGKAYRFSLKDAVPTTDEEFNAMGGNTSKNHVDFMIGSGAMDIDGINADGTREPVMRKGEWAFEV